MISVIIAGGSGTRLWPLSTPDYPKHLLKLTGSKTLLQYTYERAKLLNGPMYVISEASHVQHVHDQLPELAAECIIAEPGRRGTASCVIATLSKLKSQHDANEPIVFMHADAYIRDSDGFKESLLLAGQTATARKQLVLLGIEPTHAATGYGYIERGEHINGGQVYTVKSFKEKPDRPTAEHYLHSGHYLWNMGYFVAPLAVFEQALQTHAPDLWAGYQKLLAATDGQSFDAAYLDLKSAPIDTALIEQVDNLLVLMGTFDWMDVGSYPDLHFISDQDDDGNTVEGKVAIDDVTNSLVRNHTNTPVAVIGLDNVAVISTDYGILVTNKSHAQKVGDTAKKLTD